MADKKTNPANTLKIQIDDDTAQGCYTNLVMLNHTETEFVFDFVYVQPQQPKAKVRSRILCNPQRAKGLLHALADNIKMYENRFGPIKNGDGSSGEVMH